MVGQHMLVDDAGDGLVGKLAALHHIHRYVMHEFRVGKLCGAAGFPTNIQTISA